MQLRFVQTLLQSNDGAAKISSIAWSPNNAKLAVVTADKIVHLFDENGEKQDKFSCKPADSSKQKPYTVRAIAWSPDSTKLAIAQSDCIVFVYKLSSGPETAARWGEKKSICNKFVQTSSLTCMTWPQAQPNVVVFGLQDGKVRIGNLKTNKSQMLYPGGSLVVSLVSSPDGSAILSGHADGSIFRFFFEGGGAQGIFTRHSSAPYCLAWGAHIAAAGCDRRIVFYDEQGRVVQNMDYSREDGEREPSAIEASPSGQTIVLAGFNRMRIFNFSSRRNGWDEAPVKTVDNLYSITALSWKLDGSRLALGSLCGATELYDCCLRKTTYKGKFEFNYVGPSQVIVKQLSTGTRIVLKSHYNYEITKVNILGNDQYLVAHTTDTLLLGDLQSCKLSEIAWRGSGNEKFYFEIPTVCMIFNAGELTLVEYGDHEPLGSVRTEHMNPHQISVRINDRPRRDGEQNKKIAYLVDLRTIAIYDFVQAAQVGTIDHDARVDWMELNETGRKLLFRDRRHRLHLYDLATQTRTPILTYCTYVQWVPSSDVVVAQNKGTLCVWYNIDAPERVTTFPIRGDVEDIERVNNHTEVIVDEGVNTVSYALDEGLIEFRTAVDDGTYDRAVAFLETLALSPECEAMWRTLAGLALETRDLAVAQRCFAALGDVSRVQYLQETNAIILAASSEYGNPMDHYAVRARLAVLERQYKIAETIYLEQGRIEDAIEMYTALRMYDDAIAVAEARNHPDVEGLRRAQAKWLLDSGQQDKAAELKELQGDYQGAIAQYISAGMPARAAQLVAKRDELARSSDTVERVATALVSAGLHARAGELFEKVKMNQRALDAYRKGRAYRKAVDLARTAFPTQVVPLEEEWADFLVSQKQMDAAINHYIEAGCSLKAIEAAVSSRQWAKAAQIVEMQDDSVARPYYRVIADHYAEVRDYPLAQRYYLASKNPRAAVDMYIKAGRWDDVHTLAQRYLTRDEAAGILVQQAVALEARGRYGDAEKMYLSMGEHDLAINMFKKIGRYDDMMRLVKKHHPDLVDQTHAHLAKELESDSHYVQAEQHYIAGGDWKGAVDMYRSRDMWEDAHRVAKQFGGPIASQQIAYLWARTLGSDSAVKLLLKLAVLEPVIELACEQAAFDFAKELSKLGMPSKMGHVHLKHAMALEDEGRFEEAETEFIAANKPKEAVLMFVHLARWDDAQRIAEAHDPESVADVLVGQARSAFQSGDCARGESFLLRAHRPEIAIKYYREAGMWQDVLRIAKEYVPTKLDELQEEYESLQSKSGGARDIVATAKTYEGSGDYVRAVDAYLKLVPEMTSDHDFLEEMWEKAVELATKFTPNRATIVVATVSTRLRSLGRHEPAADLYLAVDMVREAVEACVEGALWDKARSIAREHLPELLPGVEAKYVEVLRRGGGRDHAEKLVSVDVQAGLNLFAERGEWDQCLAAAEKQGGAVLAKYSALYAAHFLHQGNPIGALGVLRKHGAPPLPQNFNLYRKVVADMLTQAAVPYDTWAALRDLLFDLLAALARANISDVIEEFERYMLVCHYFALRVACTGSGGLKELSAKIAISLVRDTDLVPADRAYVEAGTAAKECGWDNIAFVLLNRALDLYDAIEEGALDALDNTEFACTDFPMEVPLPAQQFLSEGKREEIHEWVLGVSMDQRTKQSLPRDDRGCFAAALRDPATGRSAPPCIVSGYPALRERVTLNQCVANKEDWNKFVMAMKTSHSEQLKDVLRFLGQYCGAPQNPTYSFN
eukprot:m.24360 g.24360  ORF g.24360 m.24360 type:complete len:1745 (-) comp8673_c1_seq1:35-5269(-)